jgi:transcriptional regulator with XRE-family HTH domain
MKKQRNNPALLSEIVKKIKQLREEKNISQEMFYFDTEIHIARIESGKANITVSTLKDICDYFQVSLSEFFASIK